MKETEMQRIEPFFVKARARQRVLLTLIANGHDVRELEKWTLHDLKQADLPVFLSVYRQQILEEAGAGGEQRPAFAYPNGAAFKSYDIYRIIRQATKRVMGEEAGPAELRAYVKGKM